MLANSRAWGGQPTASYSGNGIAMTPEQQFEDERVGSDASRRAASYRRQRRHRAAAGILVSPIVQWASSRPYTPFVGFDINGDGQVNISTACARARAWTPCSPRAATSPPFGR